MDVYVNEIKRLAGFTGDRLGRVVTPTFVTSFHFSRVAAVTRYCL